MAGHGGSRPGAGRPRKHARPAAEPAISPAATLRHYETSEAYLSAVVRGDEPADELRISAARTLIRYEAKPRRVPLAPGETPRSMAQREARVAEETQVADFATKAAEIRRRHGRR